MLVEVHLIASYAAFVVLAWLLCRRFRQTRDKGFLWLGLALIVWPLVSSLVSLVEQEMVNLASHGASAVYPYSLVAKNKLTLGGAQLIVHSIHSLVTSLLAIVGVVKLYSRRHSSLD